MACTSSCHEYAINMRKDKKMKTDIEKKEETKENHFLDR